MKNVLVTGGAGFIGSNFINHILSKRDDLFIVNIDKLTYAGNLENLKESEGKSNYKFVKGDITNNEFVNFLFEKYKFNYVVNFAAETHVDRSILGSEVFFKTNVIGTNVLLEAAKRYSVERYLQISTADVIYFADSSLF
ncbi:MAG TPA: GDP-mannose 4,6-dehydratase [Ignavibacteriales bacterium]|nr:GDP-mannose 4,6-dehydratase [Ignavibacteriales bacterium]